MGAVYSDLHTRQNVLTYVTYVHNLNGISISRGTAPDRGLLADLLMVMAKLIHYLDGSTYLSMYVDLIKITNLLT